MAVRGISSMYHVFVGLKCGKKRVFLDPAYTEQLSTVSSRALVRKFVKSNAIIRKKIVGVSRYRCRLYREAKRKGRHMGLGKRKGTKNARMPRKVLWMRRQRVLRRLLVKYREQQKIDRSMYRQFYLKSKGNSFPNKRRLIEAIWAAKNEKNKEKALLEQRDAKKAKANAKRERKAAGASSAAAAAQPSA